MVKTRTKGYLVLVAVFLLGAATGGGASFALTQKRHAAILRNAGGPREPRLTVLKRKLDLDADQEARVGVILHEHRGQVDTEIRAVLRPDQQTRFDKLIEQRKDRGAGRGPR
jgi:hypothetical protein